MTTLNRTLTLLACCLALPLWAQRPMTVSNQAERPWTLISIPLDEAFATSQEKIRLKGEHHAANREVRTEFYELPLRVDIAGHSKLALSLADDTPLVDVDGFLAAFVLADQAGDRPGKMHLAYTIQEEADQPDGYRTVLDYRSPLGTGADGVVARLDPQGIAILSDSWAPVLRELDWRKSQGCCARFGAWLAGWIPFLPAARAESAPVAPAPRQPDPLPVPLEDATPAPV